MSHCSPQEICFSWSWLWWSYLECRPTGYVLWTHSQNIIAIYWRQQSNNNCYQVNSSKLILAIYWRQQSNNNCHLMNIFKYFCYLLKTPLKSSLKIAVKKVCYLLKITVKKFLLSTEDSSQIISTIYEDNNQTTLAIYWRQ